MKYVLTLLLAIVTIYTSSAQQHNIYIDAGYIPGVSVTYNYQLTNHLSAGVGLQGYRFAPTKNLSPVFMPSLYADLRINIRTAKKNQFFTFFDFGINFYKQDKSFSRDSTHISHYPHNNGFNFGIGLGYFRRMTKRGGGPYLSLKMLSNWYTARGYSIVSEKDEKGLLVLEARPVISIGFKF